MTDDRARGGLIIQGLTYRKLKDRFRGYILDLRTREILCYVYGKTLEEMRERRTVMWRALAVKS